MANGQPKSASTTGENYGLHKYIINHNLDEEMQFY